MVSRVRPCIPHRVYDFRLDPPIQSHKNRLQVSMLGTAEEVLGQVARPCGLNVWFSSTLRGSSASHSKDTARDPPNKPSHKWKRNHRSSMNGLLVACQLIRMDR